MSKLKKVPLEAAVKYLIKERDELKAKLDILVPYTKKIEADLKSRQDFVYAECWKEINALTAERDQLKAENIAYRKDFKTSNWYNQLHGNLEKLRAENKFLKAELSRTRTELYLLKHKEENDL